MIYRPFYNPKLKSEMLPFLSRFISISNLKRMSKDKLRDIYYSKMYEIWKGR